MPIRPVPVPSITLISRCPKVSPSAFTPNSVKILSTSKFAKFMYSADWIVWGGMMISATTQPNQSFFSGKSYRANP